MEKNMTMTNKKLPTHEIFDVQQREGQKAFWNKVGAAFENKDASHSLLLYQPGLPAPKRLQLRRIDRERFPVRDGLDPRKAPSHEVFVVIDVEGAPNEWRRVGVAFTNKDDSLSLIVDDGVRDGPKARFQMRLRRDAPKATAPEQTADKPVSAEDAARQGPRTMIRKNKAA